jgi:acyl-CoA synthetase (NDP forming)
MTPANDLDVFLNPKSVAIIGATERPGSWGSFIMNGLLSRDYSGKIFPINRNADLVYGIRAFKNIGDINESIDLAIFCIPQQFVETEIKACAQKHVRGITIITAGFGESSKEGKQKQQNLARLARSHGIRILGPNVSGTFNLHGNFNASSIIGAKLMTTPLAGICQGGYALYNILSSGWDRGIGLGKFIHTGNESDLTVTDFLEHFRRDPEIKAVVMYLEAVRDGRRFIKAARQLTKTKPVVVYKGGKSSDSARAAYSHTGALAGKNEVYQGIFQQAGIVSSPTMELLLPLAHALIERPPMKGNRVGIITIGGSWGVALTDALVEAQLCVPEFSGKLQNALRSLGMPDRTSIRNPVDFGASGMFFSTDVLLAIGQKILSSGEVDALILHGVGRGGMHTDETPEEWKIFLDFEKQQIRGFAELEKASGLPVLIGSHYNPWQSQAVSDLNKEGIRIYNRLYEIAQLVAAMNTYWKYKRVNL